MKTVTVTWLDGTVEKISVLYLSQRNGILSLEIDRHDWRQIPLTSIREWRVTE